MFKLKFLLAGFLLAQQSLALWPIPQNMTTGSSNLAVDVSKIVYSVCGSSNSILDRAISRYGNLIAKEKFSPPLDYNIGTLATSGNFQNLEINVDSNSTLLNMETDESYKLDIDASGNASLSSKTVFGAMRGLETFSQLIIYNGGKHIIRDAPISITDKPVFAHRGIMLDTSRTFYAVKNIKKVLETMSYSKLNVFHWHIVDALSWPIESKFDPQLTAKGAYSPEMTYSYADVGDIISFAADRGIRVIPEFDMPSHSYIISTSNPDIISCPNTQPNWISDSNSPPTGQLNIAKIKSLDFAQNVISEYASLFQDDVFHVGGSGVNTTCWNKDPDVIKYLNQSGEKVESLLSKFYDRVYSTVQSAKKTPMAREDTLLTAGFKLPSNTLVQVSNNENNVATVANMGYKVIASPSNRTWLDCGHGTFLANFPLSENVNSYHCGHYKTWMNIYGWNPYKGITSDNLKNLVGGEVVLWSELADEVNFERLIWPRASSAGELFWSGPYLPGTTTIRDIRPAYIRINELRFRLLHRGVTAEPLGPLWCIRNPTQCQANRAS